VRVLEVGRVLGVNEVARLCVWIVAGLPCAGDIDSSRARNTEVPRGAWLVFTPANLNLLWCPPLGKPCSKIHYSLEFKAIVLLKTRVTAAAAADPTE
jgi:hypothetical protein